ncbi:MAG: Calx-beta domain-containing protein [Sulfurimonas sp.]
MLNNKSLNHKKNDVKTLTLNELNANSYFNANASIDEANTTMSFTASLKGVLKDDESLSVAFQTASGSATDGIDYGSTQKTVEFVNAVSNNFTITCKKVA